MQADSTKLEVQAILAQTTASLQVQINIALHEPILTANIVIHQGH